MVVRAFAKKPVQPEKKPAPQQQKAQNNAQKAVPAKMTLIKPVPRNRLKYRFKISLNRLKKINPSRITNRRTPVINLLLRITNSAIKIRLKTIITRITKTIKRTISRCSSMARVICSRASRAKTISRTVLSARREVFLSDRKDSSPGRVPSRTVMPQDSSKAVLKTRTAAASRAANSSLTKTQ